MRVPSKTDTPVLVGLVLASLVVNLLLLAWLGIREGGDTFRYIESAKDLLSGQPFSVGNARQYLGYIGVVALASAAGTGLAGVIAIQFAAAALATIALFDLGRRLSGRVAGIVASGLFAVDVDVARWHSYVLTDSLYISFVVLAVWSIHRAVEHGAGGYLLAAAAVLATASIRPNGWMFLPLAGLYWIVRSPMRKWTRVAIVGAGVAVVGGILTLVLYERYDAMVVRPRQWDNAFVFAERFLGLLGVGAGEPQRLGDAVERIFIELRHTRPDYSFLHNALIVAMLAVVYPLAAIGYIRCRTQPLVLLILAVIVGNMLVVGVTFWDGDGRYLLFVFPLILLLAGSGVSALAARARRSGAPTLVAPLS